MLSPPPVPPSSNRRVRRAILRAEFDGPTLVRRIVTPTVILPAWVIAATREGR